MVYLQDIENRTVGLSQTPEKNRRDFARLYKAYSTYVKEHHIGALRWSYPTVQRRSITFGHMCIHPGDDKVCYCGGKGHAWCYLSSDRLEEICDGPYWNFFTQLEAGDPECKKFFERFLDDLALLVYNVRMMHNSDVVLGGYLGTHLRPYLPDLEKRLQKLDHLYLESKTKVLIGQYDLEAAGVGAARYFIEQFIVSLS